MLEIREINIEFYKYIAVTLVLCIGFFLRAFYVIAKDFISDIKKELKESTKSINTLNTNFEKHQLKQNHNYDLILKNTSDLERINNEISILRDFKHKHLHDYDNFKEILKINNENK